MDPILVVNINIWLGDFRLTIPNPHQSDISKALLAKILRQAEISRDEWEELD